MNSKSVFVFANMNEGQAILGKKDIYLKAMTSYERSLKMGTSEFVSDEEFISFIKKSVFKLRI